MKNLLKLCTAIMTLGSLIALGGCAEKPKDPIKENEGQGQVMEVPARRERSMSEGGQ